MANHGADGFGVDAADAPFRQLAVVLVCGLIGVLIALAALAMAPPRYHASAELALASPAAAAEAEDAATSDVVLAAVAAALTPEPDQVQGLDRLRVLFAEALSPKSAASAGVAALRGRITVDRSSDRVVITAVGDDGRDAARLADAVARAVLAHRPATPAPRPAPPPPEDDRRLDQARAEAEARSAAVQRVTEALLAELRARLALARVRSAEQRVRLAQIERLTRTGADAGSVPEVRQSLTLAALRSQVGATLRRERQAARMLGSRHPSIKALREERQRAERLIRTELQKIAAAARLELERAEAAEQALAVEIEIQRGGVVAAVEALTRLRALEQAAPGSPPPTPVQRSEAPPAAGTPGRLVAAAVPPARPEGLPTAAVLGIGLAAGCGIGAAVAVARRRAPP
ncbi:hypothetical protein [Blastochloris viridis]|uniref:Capsular polysaccharide biosynthesis protein n=1 Tax=Blastochloris viridis TaxID=1079 RepID=A0A0H5B8A7_BLAVI|nr:hypothetical protein [Blastochloris viridis]ALK08309.1 hypothetical protein BVIR_511 [Blastochloris viridis]BAR98422.1 SUCCINOGLYCAN BIOSYNTHESIS TRANSPORT PROTEIN EXOP [Blastochloris viridis]CUU44231.1 Capsular polysaccharide biosynthesis protein [Blastochloris viridis]